MPSGIDHVVILVEDLERGMEQYRALGFNVTPGGRHPRYTHNALVPFQDGAYLELIAFYERPSSVDDPHGHRWYRYLEAGGGIIDYALSEPELDALLADADTRGFAHSGPNPGARRRPDGAEIAWKTATPRSDAGNVGALPFLIEDVTDRNLRVPVDAAGHENTVRGIESIVVAVRDLDAAAVRYARLLGRDAPSGEHVLSVENADGVYFLVGTHRIDLVTPRGSGPLREHLEQRGDGPFALSLLARESRDIDPSTAGNARLRLVAG
jgi:catechol 2,3-dioxygenase-like lactoylglutathione lyase family enzyme